MGEPCIKTTAGKTLHLYREPEDTFVVLGGDEPRQPRQECLTPLSQAEKRSGANGENWYYIPAELGWLPERHVMQVNQFDLAKYPVLARYNAEHINALVWMKQVPEIRSDEMLWHLHPILMP